MHSIEVKIKAAASAGDIAAALNLRQQVFCAEQGFSPEIEQDGEDNGADHIIAVTGIRTVGCGRIRYFGSYAKLERIAVNSSLRGTGIGRQILNFMVEHCRRRGIAKLRLSAQVHSLRFYSANGFIPEGEPFDVEGVGHQMMCRSI